MAAINGGTLKPEHIPLLTEGISLVFSRWTSLNDAVQQLFGGTFSLRKADLLASDVLSFFTKSKHTIFVEDLEELLDRNMMDYFNLDFKDDNSPNEVANDLMDIYEELLRGELTTIEDLRRTRSKFEAVSKSKMVVMGMSEDDDDDDDASSSDDAMSVMESDDPKSLTMRVDDKEQQSTEEANDGWSLVSSKRNKGKRR
ncbi:hypothetical protein ACHQM5_004032 [Ranunculus cassubicifolius]